MEHIATWVAIVIPLALSFVGWIFNTLITNKIDELKSQCASLEKGREDDKSLFFARLDAIKDAYVRKDMYEQAMQFHQKETDSKFNNLVESMNKQFENVEGKIDDIKDLINEKFNGKNNQK